MLDYDRVKAWRIDDLPVRYTRRDTMLYALGLGLGADPVDLDELRYVYERDLRALPTFATTFGAGTLLWRDPSIGADAVRLVHGEQEIRVLEPLPPEGDLVLRARVAALIDKGPATGAVGIVESALVDPARGATLVEQRHTVVLRGDGGFSARSGISDPAPTPLPTLPARAPDLDIALPILPQAALLYRLSGDDNPLHADPAFAAAAGFDRPILHGLCTYGMAGHAAIRHLLGNDPARLGRYAVRFTAPVWPGETLTVSLWREPAGIIRLAARVAARGALVLDRGLIEER